MKWKGKLPTIIFTRFCLHIFNIKFVDVLVLDGFRKMYQSSIFWRSLPFQKAAFKKLFNFFNCCFSPSFLSTTQTLNKMNKHLPRNWFIVCFKAASELHFYHLNWVTQGYIVGCRGVWQPGGLVPVLWQ